MDYEDTLLQCDEIIVQTFWNRKSLWIYMYTDMENSTIDKSIIDEYGESLFQIRQSEWSFDAMGTFTNMG